jgi:hypothetical protein
MLHLGTYAGLHLLCLVQQVNVCTGHGADLCRHSLGMVGVVVLANAFAGAGISTR